MKTTILALTTAAVATCFAAPAGADAITSNVALTVQHVGEPSVLYRGITIFPVDQQGMILDGVSFDTTAEPGVFVGDESSNTPRPVETIEFTDMGGMPGNLLISFMFAESSPWSAGETLTFHFTVLVPEGVRPKFDVQFVVVPAPASALALVAGGVIAARRRRSL